jgi:myo-inositol-1(or 4)-monophosphatase
VTHRALYSPGRLTNATQDGRIALRAAFAAGRVLAEKFYEPRQVTAKGFRDIVTDADFAADRAARAILTRAAPGYAIRSEEDRVAPVRASHVWLMDPLDGTTNYARRIPIFSVSIALVRRGQPLVGVVLDPLRRECFFAERGRGAYLNGQRVRASSVDSFDRAVVGYELARAPRLRGQGLRLFAHFARQSVTARVGGSAALSLCYVGAGRLDTYMQLTLSPWDVAAGMLIAREGGARVTHLDGRPATLRGGAYLAGAPKLFPEFVAQIQSMRWLDATNGR